MTDYHAATRNQVVEGSLPAMENGNITLINFKSRLESEILTYL